MSARLSWLLCLLPCFVSAQFSVAELRKMDDDVDFGPMPAGPPSQLPSLDGSAFPPYRTIFIRGECDSNDVGLSINTNKTCFQCFRIPSMIKTNAPGEGTILAFAEARRGEAVGYFHGMSASGMFGCPDIPDTRVVYKRSADGGKTWGPLKVFTESPGRKENGNCQSQPQPVVDPETNTIFVIFNADGPCLGGAWGFTYIINSTDDGVTWSVPEKLKVNGLVPGPGAGPVSAPTKGLTVTGPNGQTRLVLAGEGGRDMKTFGAQSIYSDDHGTTWNLNGTLAAGEIDWAVCTPGACGGQGKYARINRENNLWSVAYSNDVLNWTPKRQLNASSFNVPVSSHHAAPGMVAVPGGLVMSGVIMQCPNGVRTCARKPSDVIGSGMGLLISRDGLAWKLLTKLWPYGGMYSTLIPLTVDKDGGALTYAVIYSAGTIGGTGVEVVNFQNFTFSPSDLDILDKQDPIIA